MRPQIREEQRMPVGRKFSGDRANQIHNADLAKCPTEYTSD
jgi:hypothetical protein